MWRARGSRVVLVVVVAAVVAMVVAVVVVVAVVALVVGRYRGVDPPFNEKAASIPERISHRAFRFWRSAARVAGSREPILNGKLFPGRAPKAGAAAVRLTVDG